MWIRSQDRQHLLDVTVLYIGVRHIDNAFYIDGCADGTAWFLGKYEDLERAQAVLDDIQLYLYRGKISVYSMPLS